MFRKKMQTKKDTGEIFNIPPYLIKPNPSLARTEFPDTSLCSLADSIRRYGILQPLAVRLSESGRYELIAGERRLRAAVLLGLGTVPCVLVDASKDYEYLSVVENLQREKLGMFDEARAIKRLYVRSGRNLAETARLLSMGESEVSAKLKLTRLSRAEMQAVSRLGIGEKAAVLLSGMPSQVRFYAIKICAEREMCEEDVSRLCDMMSTVQEPTPDDLEEAVRAVIDTGSSAKKQEEQKENAGASKESLESSGRTTVILRDLRLFENSLERSLEIIRKAGFEASFASDGEEDARVYTVKLYRKDPARQNSAE